MLLIVLENSIVLSNILKAKSVKKYAEEVMPDPNYGRGEICGGRWYRNIETGQIWRLIEPDFPFRGLWEPITK